MPRVLIGLALAIALAACGGDDEPTENVVSGTLQAGETYVVHEVALRVPDGHDLRVGELERDPCAGACENGFYLHVVATEAWIGILTPSGSEFARDSTGDAALDAWFDDLIASIAEIRAARSTR